MATETESTDSLVPQGLPSPHESPVLSALPDSSQPAPLPACSDCPSAAWYVTTKGLRCHCHAFKMTSWDPDELEPVLACDAREQAIALMMQEAEKAAGGGD